METKSTRVIFTPKAESALAEIIKKYKLPEFEGLLKIDAAAKGICAETISEKDAQDFLAKNLNVSQDVAVNITKEVKANIVPFLEKVPEDKFKNTEFIEEISKKIWGEEKKLASPSGGKESAPQVTIVKKPLPVKEKNIPTPPMPLPAEPVAVKPLKPKKNIERPNIEEPLPPKKLRGKDTYREPIE